MNQPFKTKAGVSKTTQILSSQTSSYKHNTVNHIQNHKQNSNTKSKQLNNQNEHKMSSTKQSIDTLADKNHPTMLNGLGTLNCLTPQPTQ